MEHNAQKTYIAIDLKSFYASVECVERKFDPLTTNLVVADESRTEILHGFDPECPAVLPGDGARFHIACGVKIRIDLDIDTPVCAHSWLLSSRPRCVEEADRYSRISSGVASSSGPAIPSTRPIR